jgi:hypothetical protein
MTETAANLTPAQGTAVEPVSDTADSISAFGLTFALDANKRPVGITAEHKLTLANKLLGFGRLGQLMGKRLGMGYHTVRQKRLVGYMEKAKDAEFIKLVDEWHREYVARRSGQPITEEHDKLRKRMLDQIEHRDAKECASAIRTLAAAGGNFKVVLAEGKLCRTLADLLMRFVAGKDMTNLQLGKTLRDDTDDVE